jgi:hypothetical protein
MNIHSILSLSPDGKALAQQLWEENMHEPWADYNGSDMFVVLDGGEMVGGFAVYLDDSDGIKGTFCSGWAKHHAHVPTDRIIKQIVSNVGPVYFKTDQRPAKILLEKIGKKVKTTDRFVYYIVKGE